MKIERKILKNNIALNIIETSKFKTNYFSVNFLVPLDKNTAPYNALIPNVLLRGSRNHSKMMDINKRLDELYRGRIFYKNQRCGEVQVFGLGCEFLDNSYALDGLDILKETMSLFGEVLTTPYTENGVFSVNYVESEKRNLIDAINAKINNKTRYAIERCIEEMCINERFGISALGKIQDIEAISAQSLYSHYNRVLTESRVEIYFIGSASSDKIEKLVQTYLSEKLRSLNSPLETEIIKGVSDIKEIEEPFPVKQSKLALGFRTGTLLSDENFIDFAMFNKIYGSSPTSKLFMNVREKLSLCYYCHAIPESQKGVMIVTCGIETQNKQKTMDEILKQLKEVACGNISDEEFDSAVKSLKNSYTEIYDSASLIESWYLRRMLCGRNDSPEEAIESISSVTKDKIARVASKITLDTVYFLKGISEE